MNWNRAVPESKPAQRRSEQSAIAAVLRNVHQRSRRSLRIKAATAAAASGAKIRMLRRGKPSLEPGEVMARMA